MLRGNVLDSGIAYFVMALVVIWIIYMKRKTDKGPDDSSPYEDGKPSRKSNILLVIFLVFAAICILATIFLYEGACL